MTDEVVLAAFHRGQSAARANVSRASNPYMPCTEDDLWQAWNAGWDEEEPSYRVRG